MEFAYRPELWESFFDMVALASVTLTGLLSVALSINLHMIVHSPEHLARGREALISLTVLLTVAVFVLIPQQGRVALGIELLALGFVVLVIGLRLQFQTLKRLRGGRRGFWLRRLILLNSATLAIVFAGASLTIGWGGGFLWLVWTTLVCLVWSTYNAWSLAITAVDHGKDVAP